MTEIENAINTFATTKAAWVYLVAGIIGVTFSIGYAVLEERRKWVTRDTWRLLCLNMLVIPLCLWIDRSPFISIALGVFQEMGLNFTRNKVKQAFDWAGRLSITSLITFLLRLVGSKVSIDELKEDPKLDETPHKNTAPPDSEDSSTKGK